MDVSIRWNNVFVRSTLLYEDPRRPAYSGQMNAKTRQGGCRITVNRLHVAGFSFCQYLFFCIFVLFELPFYPATITLSESVKTNAAPAVPPPFGENVLLVSTYQTPPKRHRHRNSARARRYDITKTYVSNRIPRQFRLHLRVAETLAVKRLP